MADYTATFDFDELVIPILGKNDSGMMLYGSADLEGDEDGFYVSAIYLADGTKLKARGAGYLGLPSAFEEELFRRMAAVIENPKTKLGGHALIEWATAVEQANQPDPDYLRDLRRDEAIHEPAMFKPRPGLSKVIEMGSRT